MKRVARRTSVSNEFIRQVGNPNMVVDLPPYPNWFARGPRGGIYLAVGERTRWVTEAPDDWDRNTQSVIDQSDGSRYIRPGTRLYREAVEQLGAQ